MSDNNLLQQGRHSVEIVHRYFQRFRVSFHPYAWSIIGDHPSIVIKWAACWDLGLMTHWKGLGWLCCSIRMIESTKKNLEKAHLIVPVVCSCTGSMTTPPFENFVTSKTASAIAQMMKTEVSAKKRPEAMLTLLQEI